MKNYGEVGKNFKKRKVILLHKNLEELLSEPPFSTIRWCKKALISKYWLFVYTYQYPNLLKKENDASEFNIYIYIYDLSEHYLETVEYTMITKRHDLKYNDIKTYMNSPRIHQISNQLWCHILKWRLRFL